MEPRCLNLQICQESWHNDDRIYGTAEFMFTKDDYDECKEYFDDEYFLLQYADRYGASHEYQCAMTERKTITNPLPDAEVVMTDKDVIFDDGPVPVSVRLNKTDAVNDMFIRMPRCVTTSIEPISYNNYMGFGINQTAVICPDKGHVICVSVSGGP